MSLRSDNFDSVGELYTKDDLGELVVTIETAPAFFSGLGKLEDHGECCLVGKTPLERTVRWPSPDGRETEARLRISEPTRLR